MPTTRDSTSAQLRSILTGVRRRATLGLVLRVCAGAAGGTALLATTGSSLFIALAVPVAGVIAALLGPSHHQAAKMLDRAAGTCEEVECAWDHRADGAPIAILQRRRVVERLGSRRIPAVRRVSLAWSLGPLLWGWPIYTLTQTEPLASPLSEDNAPLSEAAIADSSRQGADSADLEPVDPMRPPDGLPPATSRAGAAAPPDTHPDAPEADGGLGGPPRTKKGTSERADGRGSARTGAGIGGKAGDQRAGEAGRKSVKIQAGEGAELGMDRGAGTGPPDPDADPRSEGGSEPVDSAVGLANTVAFTPTDPARPYPTRYQSLITAWFEQQKARSDELPGGPGDAP